MASRAATSNDIFSPLPASRMETALALARDEKEIITFVTQERDALLARWSPQKGGRAWMHENALLLDCVLRRLFALSLERCIARSATESPTGDGVVILAVGGYGQKLPAPFSDVDITFLAARDDEPPVLREMFRLVMDVLLAGVKLKVGYAYRTLSEVGGDTLDHHTQTALLDARFLAGDYSLFTQFDQAYRKNLHAADFLFRKEAERRKIRGKWGGTPFIAEPNVKEGVGGLRDVQTAAWMARARFGKSGESLWRDLVHRHIITKQDLRALARSRDLLLTVRCALHLSSGERRDLLTAARQEAVAKRLNYADEEQIPSVERFMSDYYRAAGRIWEVADKVIERCLDAPLALEAESGLSSVRRTLAVTDPEKLKCDSLWPLTALEFCQAHDLPLSPSAEEAIEQHLESKAWNPDDTDARNALLRAAGTRFVALLGRPGDAGATLRRMRRTGLLRSLLPELDACMGLIPYDPAHAHTIGEHSLRVLENLVALRETIPDDDPKHAAYRALLTGLSSPATLLLAALLHDTGKQWPHDLAGARRPHAETGAERVAAVCRRLGVPRSEAETVAFLVRHHLLLAETSRLRDLSLGSVVQEAAEIVGDRERLRMLYLLTYADTRAVGPGVWTDMTARLLCDLFTRLEDTLGDSGVENTPPLDHVRQRLARRLTRKTTDSLLGSEGETRAHIEAMPAVYLLNTPPETIVRHLELITQFQTQERESHAASEGVVLDMRKISPDAEQTEITLAARDKPGLLARITGVLLACDVRLHWAQVFTRDLPPTSGEPTRIALDTLCVDYRDRPLGRDKRGAVEEAVRVVLSGEETVTHLLLARRKPPEVLPPVRSVHVSEAVSAEAHYTLVDMESPDDLGVVFRFASLFSGLGWDIHAARVSTWGGNARCAFYLTDAAGRPLPIGPTRRILHDTFALSQEERA